MSATELQKLLRDAFDVNRQYVAPYTDSSHDSEYIDALHFYDDRSWCDVSLSDITAGYPAFCLLPEEAFVFFYSPADEPCKPLHHPDIV